MIIILWVILIILGFLLKILVNIYTTFLCKVWRISLTLCHIVIGSINLPRWKLILWLLNHLLIEYNLWLLLLILPFLLFLRVVYHYFLLRPCVIWNTWGWILIMNLNTMSRVKSLFRLVFTHHHMMLLLLLIIDWVFFIWIKCHLILN